MGEEDGGLGGCEKGKVCVTGATGYVASWLIKRLLEDGYSVHATVRPDPPPPEKKKDITFLKNLPLASQNLRFFEADLSHPESFSAPIKGCKGVFHIAHPMDMEGKEPVEIVTKRSINGLIGILKACVDSKTVNRVVYMGSAAAVVYNPKVVAYEEDDVKVVDESSWSDVEFINNCKIRGAPYSITKTLTEKAALEFAEEYGLNVVTVNPPFITGPFISPRVPGSVYVSLALIFDDPEFYSYLMNMELVHVDDLARAQIFLLECPNAKGRYICSAAKLKFQEMPNFLEARYPDLYQIHKDIESCFQARTDPIKAGLSSKKLLDAGFKFKYSLEDIYDDAIQCCRERGLL